MVWYLQISRYSRNFAQSKRAYHRFKFLNENGQTHEWWGVIVVVQINGPKGSFTSGLPANLENLENLEFWYFKSKTLKTLDFHKNAWKPWISTQNLQKFRLRQFFCLKSQPWPPQKIFLFKFYEDFHNIKKDFHNTFIKRLNDERIYYIRTNLDYINFMYIWLPWLGCP